MILALIAVNILLSGWALWSVWRSGHKAKLDFLCESALEMNSTQGGGSKPFRFEGTVLVRFKPDETGYLWLQGSASYDNSKSTVAREIEFNYRSRDEKGIYTITPVGHNVTSRDNTPGTLIERHMTGVTGMSGSYVVRQANANTYSIGSIYSPIIMCVDRA